VRRRDGVPLNVGPRGNCFARGMRIVGRFTHGGEPEVRKR
jgi:hypothetical protein